MFSFGPLSFDLLLNKAFVNRWSMFTENWPAQAEVPATYREPIIHCVTAIIRSPDCYYFHRRAAHEQNTPYAKLGEISFLENRSTQSSATYHVQEYNGEAVTDEIEQTASPVDGQTVGVN